MAISKDLFLAMLAMDSYNRGYGSGVADGKGLKDENGKDIDGLGAEGASIGGAIVVRQDISEAAKDAGFYAVAYNVAAGAWEGFAVHTRSIGCDAR